MLSAAWSLKNVCRLSPVSPQVIFGSVLLLNLQMLCKCFIFETAAFCASHSGPSVADTHILDLPHGGVISLNTAHQNTFLFLNVKLLFIQL